MKEIRPLLVPSTERLNLSSLVSKPWRHISHTQIGVCSNSVKWVVPILLELVQEKEHCIQWRNKHIENVTWEIFLKHLCLKNFLVSCEIQILISASVMPIKVLKNAFNFTKNTHWFKLYSYRVIHYQHASKKPSSIRCGITR